jgi:hypothetical protein
VSRIGASRFAEERRIALDVEDVILDLKGEADFGAKGAKCLEPWPGCHAGSERS